MRLYRIYTENKNREDLEHIVGTVFESFSILEAKGFWKGSAESSLIIEILDDANRKLDVEFCAIQIRDWNAQEAVLVTSQIVDTTLI